MTTLAAQMGGWIRVADVPVVRGAMDFDSFYRADYWSVVGLAIVLTGNAQTAEEIAQDAFLAAFDSWDRVGRLDKPEAWVRKVVSNRSVSRFRRLRTEARALLRLGSPPTAVPDIDVAANLDLWTEVRRLPRRQAQVIALTYFADLSRQEVASILGCSEDTIKTHLRRARRTLTEQLSSSDAEPEASSHEH